jgi:membrane peptidoglycan carboxypeptidase
VWMGYPNRRVSMTDVHGEVQQGGALPADIWHAYMGPVTEGHPCAPLHTSNAGISYQAFYGKYATTGRAETFEPAPSKVGRGNHHGGRSRGGTPAPKGPRETPPHGEPPPKEAPETPAGGPGPGQAVEPSGGAGPGK